jgi:hypothetical protein
MLAAVRAARAVLVWSSGGYQAVHPRWLERSVFARFSDPVVWIVPARSLTVLKRKIELATNAAAVRLHGQPLAEWR